MALSFKLSRSSQEEERLDWKGLCFFLLIRVGLCSSGLLSSWLSEGDWMEGQNGEVCFNDLVQGKRWKGEVGP